jgi:hypothetical protein
VIGAALLRLFIRRRTPTPRLAFRSGAICGLCQGAARELVDGHTLGPVITKLEKLTAVETRRIHVDKGYRGPSHLQKFAVDHPAGTPHHPRDPTRDEAPRLSPCSAPEPATQLFRRPRRTTRLGEHTFFARSQFALRTRR